MQDIKTPIGKIASALWLRGVYARTVRAGKRGRPRKTLPKGCRERLKNKGSQRHRRGRKRPRHQASQPEHSNTAPDFPDQLSTPIIWKAIMRLYSGTIAPFGVEPTRMPRTPMPRDGPWTCICRNTTSSVHTELDHRPSAGRAECLEPAKARFDPVS